MDDFLKKYNLKYEDLNESERETLDSWLGALQKSQLSLEKIKDYIQQMRDAVEQELTKYDLGSKQDLLLKGRLRNYMLLEAFLSTPEKAKKQLEIALAGIGK